AAVDVSSFYAEMGGQVGDTGFIEIDGISLPIHVVDTVKRGTTFFLKLSARDCALAGWDKELPEDFNTSARLSVDVKRRRAIERNHTATHLLHWALHSIVGKNVVQKGSAVTPDKFTFDFNSQPLTAEQLSQVETLVNEKIIENSPVYWQEVPYTLIEKNEHIMQLFGEKYGSRVRVIQVGGIPGELDGYSMELCGGTHVRATGQIGQFRIVAESAVAAGVRRIEAVTGMAAYQKGVNETNLIRTLAGKVNSPVGEVEHKLETLVEKQKTLEHQVKTLLQKQAVSVANEWIAKAETVKDVPMILGSLGECETDHLLAVVENLRSRFAGVITLTCVQNGNVVMTAAVSKDFTSRIQAGKIIQTIAPILGGRGGGKPDFARGGGKDAAKIGEALAKVKEMI
ncbi:MAG: alanine--tRNA ligase, partial [Verrucomicrobia bacterium]|nr:alanine--tRNA ligase [Verrucomicrobiota bacterium]